MFNYIEDEAHAMGRWLDWESLEKTFNPKSVFVNLSSLLFLPYYL